MFVLFWLCFLIPVAISVTERYWYIGCYGVNTDETEHSNVTNITSDIVSCAKHCQESGFVYCGIQYGNACRCWTDNNHWHQKSEEFCKQRCSNESFLPLPCGVKADIWSMYWTEGPYLTTAELQVDADWVVVNKPVALETIVQLADFINFTKEYAKEKWTLSLEFQWTIDNITRTDNLTAEAAGIQNRIEYMFTSPGQHRVDVEIRNALSSLTIGIEVDVIFPQPKDLQVVLLADDIHLPSLPPEQLLLSPTEEAVTIFVNSTARIEASIAVGSNVTFLFELSDTESIFEYRPFESDPLCMGQNCTVVVQEHVFVHPGTFVVCVTVSNKYGEQKQNLTLVVVDKQLSNLSFTLLSTTQTRITPLTPVKFLVSMVTTSRQDTYLQIDFDDGNVHMASLGDMNCSSTYFGDNTDEAFLVKSYGEGCIMEIEIIHSIRSEGAHRPNIFVTDKITNLTFTLDEDIIVLNKIEVTHLEADDVAKTNKLTDFLLYFLSTSINMTVNWVVVDQYAVVLENLTNTCTNFSYIFPNHGIYTIVATAVNIVSSAFAKTNILIEVPVENLVMTCLQGPYIRTGDRVMCSADLEYGSEPTFVWNFHDDDEASTSTVSKNASSSASHVFDNPGTYNISVMAFNRVSREVAYVIEPITVQEPINIVRLYITAPSLLGNATGFYTKVDKGSHVEFEFDFGGRRQSYEVEEKEDVFFTKYTFSVPGTHKVTVFAFNNVSEATYTITVLVEDKIRQLKVDIIGKPVVNSTSVFIVTTADEITTRKDLLYMWQFSDGETVLTASPVMSKTFTTTGSHVINFNASNSVSEVVQDMEVYVYDESEVNILISHEVFCIVGEEIDISLKSLHGSWTTIHVHYSDGTDESYLGREFKWSHQFLKPGIYNVNVTIAMGEPEETSLHTYIIAEEPVSDLMIVGPTRVEFDDLLPEQVWESSVATGTNLLYTWFVEDNELVMGAKYMGRFSWPGIYSIYLEARNDISFNSTNITVFVQYSIMNVHVSLPDRTLGFPTNMNITVNGTYRFFIHIDFGDNNSDTISSVDKNIHIVADYSRYGPPCFFLYITHIYQEIGVYNVNLNTSNYVSFIITSAIAIVEEPITGIQLETNSSGIVRLLEPIVVKTTVATGKELKFHWDFGDQYATEVHSFENVSTAIHSYNVAGKYKVYVEVSNRLYKEAVITALPFDVHAVDEITNVYLGHKQINNSAPLNGRAPNLTTPIVTFEARSSGSNVEFAFNFGDGHTQTICGQNIIIYRDMFALAQHSYNREGAFMVSVTASNPLGNITQSLDVPFHVLIPPRGLVLDQTSYRGKVDSAVYFKANIAEGTNLTYIWDFGDGTEAFNTELNVSHHYMIPQAVQVVVIARNLVSNEKASAPVYIDYVIQEVTLKASKTLVGFGERVDFFATTYPEHISVNHFIWNFGDRIKNDKQTVEAHSHKIYSRSGWFVTTAKAHNEISNSTSNSVSVHVVALVGKLDLYFTETPLINQTINFFVYCFAGSELNFTWSFGDESPSITTPWNATRLTHTYTREGAYAVSVTAANVLSNATTSMTVFVLSERCYPPNIIILGQSGRKIHRSVPVHMEVYVQFDCNITNKAEYHWTIYNTTREPQTVVLVEDRFQQNQMLFIPPKTLQYGKYFVEVEVRMIDTIVYARAKTIINIVPTPLFITIKGGAKRTLTQENTITLDASQSSDPDFIENSNLSYNWTCKVKQSASCFNESFIHRIPLDKSVLTFPADWLVVDQGELRFEVTVSADNREDQTKVQFIVISGSETTLDLGITCQQCDIGSVSSTEKVTLQAVCSGSMCGKDNIHYKWKIYIVTDPDVYNKLWLDKSHSCLKPDASVYRPIFSMTRHIHWEEELATDGKKEDQVDEKDTDQLVTSTVQLLFDPYDELQNGRGRGKRQILDNSTFDMTASEAAAPSRHRSAPDSVYNDIVNVDMWNMHENKDSGGSSVRQFPNGDFNPSEGGPGEAGSSGGRIPGIGSPQEEAGDGRSIEAIPPSSDSRDKLVKLIRKNTKPLYVMSKLRRKMRLFPDDTSTGLRQQALVVLPNALQQGLTYVFQVEAQSEDGSVVGEAFSYLSVKEGPSHGVCTLSRDSGTEMETVFHVLCQEWNNTNKELPLIYEITYDLQMLGTQKLIYRGMNAESEFMLPAGNAENNFTVYVNISILDESRARTGVCSIAIVVQPKLLDTVNKSGDVLIFEEITSENESTTVALNRQDNGRVKVLLGYLATRLNGLQRVGPSNEVWKIRQNTRKILLKRLESLPTRDEVELLQTAQALVAITDVPQELSRVSLVVTMNILKSILIGEQQLPAARIAPSSDLLSLAVKAASNIIESATCEGRTNSHHDDGIKSIITETVGVIDGLLQAALHLHIFGEVPVQMDAEFVSVLASQYSTHGEQVIAMDDSKFLMPQTLLQNLQKFGNVTDDLSQSNLECFQARMTKFREAPFSSREKKVNSAVASLSLYTCAGTPVSLSNLSSSEMIEIQIPHVSTQSDDYPVHVLKKWQMNVHQFNVSRKNLKQALHIVVEQDLSAPGRHFPVSISVSYGHSPSTTYYFYKKQFDAWMQKLTVFLPPGSLNLSGSYYVGIVDTNFNAGRHRKGEVTFKPYTLKLWRQQCLFWNQSEEQWSTAGCWAMEESTHYITHCRCNHLTAFGSHFEVIPNELSFIDVESFFDPQKNPIVLAILGTILCIYATLFFLCHKADLHDAKKSGPAYLKDNTATDQQKYEIVIETGFRKGAGTTAKISIILHGEQGMSETRELISEHDRPLFERNSRDRFVMTLPDSIGRIWKVQLWHNNFGLSPGWYVSRVIVKDLITGKAYYFICEKWLAVEEGDGKVEREFMALEGHLGFRKVFWAKGTQYIADFHLWTSMFTRPAYHRFTSIQRLTCCLTLLLIYMSLNTAWYQLTQTEFRGEFGLMDVSGQSIAVGAICCAIVIPINLLLVFMFRRSRVSYPGGDEKDETYTSVKPEEVEISEQSEEPILPMMTCSVFDQSLLNWQNIQEWAQKQWVKRQQSVVSSTDSNSIKTTQQPPTTPTIISPVHRKVIGSETDQASSGFEDSNSQDPRPHIIADVTKLKSPSVSSAGQYSLKLYSASSEQYNRFSTRIFLPFWCRYMAWSMCLVICTGCTIFTVFYGFRFGRTKSILWVQSFYFSCMCCIFIAHPLMILVSVMYTAIYYRSDPSIFDHHEDGFYGEQMADDSCQKNQSMESCEECEEIERGVAARQRSRYLRFARPPQEKQLIEARKQTMKEKKALTILKNIITYAMLLFIVCVMAFGKDTRSPYYLNQALKNTFVRSGNLTFEQIRSPEEWLPWVQSTLLNTLFDKHMYSDQQQNNAIQEISYIIGHVQLRQLRVRREPCQTLSSLPYLHDYCHYDYPGHHLEWGAFGINGTWIYKDGGHGYHINGRHGVYDSSGYIMQLNKSRQNATSQIAELNGLKWIDQQTRAIIVEFTMYNTPTNLFTSLALLLETPSTGGAFPMARIMSTFVFRYVTGWDSFVLSCELLFILLLLFKTKNETCDVIKLGRNYIKNGWNCLEAFLCILSMVYLVCFVYRFILMSQCVERMRNTYYESFIDVSFLTFWDEMLRSIVGLLLFVTIIKFLRLLRYNRIFAKFGNVYRNTHKEILLFLGMFLFLMLAYTSLGRGLFGAFCANFGSFWTGMLGLTALLTRNYDYPEFEPYYLIHARLFIISFVTFATGLFSCYMVAILSHHYKVYKQPETIAMDTIEATKFLWQKFLYLARLKEQPPLEEPEICLPPEFIMAEIEYQVEELLFRMNALSGSHGLPEKPPCYFTDSDGTGGVGDDGISSGGSEVHIHDDDRLEQRLQKIEDCLYSQEPYLAQLLKLDSIGTDILSQEKEKQLRSHLELEIFRQLQMQRQDSLLPSIGRESGASSKSSHAGVSLSSVERSSSSASGGSRKVVLPNDIPEYPELDSTENGGADSPACNLSPVQNQNSSTTTKESSADVSSSASGSPKDWKSCLPKGWKVTRGSVHPRTGKQIFSKLSDGSDKSGSQSSDSEKIQMRELSLGVAKLPSKPTFANSGHFDILASDSPRPSLGGSPYLKQLKAHNSSSDSPRPTLGGSPYLKQLKVHGSSSERLMGRGETSSSLTTDTSSGSEQDGIRTGRRSFGKRNLRKTRSRGKGKGPDSLSPSLLLDELDMETNIDDATSEERSPTLSGRYENPEPIPEQESGETTQNN